MSAIVRAEGFLSQGVGFQSTTFFVPDAKLLHILHGLTDSKHKFEALSTQVRLYSSHLLLCRIAEAFFDIALL